MFHSDFAGNPLTQESVIIGTPNPNLTAVRLPRNAGSKHEWLGDVPFDRLRVNGNELTERENMSTQ